MVSASARNTRMVSDHDRTRQTGMVLDCYADARVALTGQFSMEPAGLSFAMTTHNKEHCTYLRLHLAFQLCYRGISIHKHCVEMKLSKSSYDEVSMIEIIFFCGSFCNIRQVITSSI